MAHPEWTRLFQVTAMNLKPGDSWHLEFDENLMPNCKKPGWKKCIVSTSGRYKCSKCGRGWSSNKVRVACHMRLSYRQGVVKVRPFRQNCKECSEAPMEKPSITSENIEILLKNVVEKIRIKCYNEDLGKKIKPFTRVDGQSPHEPAHCEACMQGICPRSRPFS
ncbi:receptor-transporting protein 3-like [Anarrhichthys ocellatus]|uniref:receptor-transporting protein 3-like n=1 Tax=Anarrhichthys ocellatus TaxID=433405 RepID=UPI0012EEADD0|nr:receptor-transporting protein 3-like [Anarrhichthys ocellatus]